MTNKVVDVALKYYPRVKFRKLKISDEKMLENDVLKTLVKLIT
jgi:hypothetical protein